MDAPDRPISEVMNESGTRSRPAHEQPARLERALVAIRWFGVGFGLFQVWQTANQPPMPPGYVIPSAYGLVGSLAAANLAILLLVRRPQPQGRLARIGLFAFALDALVLFGFAWIYSFNPNTMVWVLIYILPLEAALRYQLFGATVAIGLAFLSELGRELYVQTLFPEEPFFISAVTFRVGVLAIIALVAGYMARSLAQRAASAEQQAETFERLAEQEREAAQRLRSVDEMKNSFLQAVSHELRTPLSVVLGFAVTLERRDTELPEEDRHAMLRRLTVNARKLERLLSDLLDLDRLARGTLEVHRQPTELHTLVSRIVEEAELPEHPVRLDVHPVVAMLDGPKVERILENLLANAGRHTPSGTPVWVRTEARPGGIRIVVEDTGPGIPDSLKRTVFEPFERGHNPAHSPGTGVGLSLVMRFAELHGGSAWVEDRPGGGASFRVFLPTPEPSAGHSSTAITSPS